MNGSKLSGPAEIHRIAESMGTQRRQSITRSPWRQPASLGRGRIMARRMLLPTRSTAARAAICRSLSLEGDGQGEGERNTRMPMAPLRTTKLHLRFTPFVLALVVAAQSALAQTTETVATLKQTVEQAFPSLRTPGLSVAAAAKGEILWAKGFGFSDLENKKPATSKTIYRYASISKPIAATAVMQLVEQGKVSLDVPIQRYVPTFPVKPEGEITLRHLMTHTSGIRHYRGLEMLNNRRYPTVEAALGIFKDDPLEFKPGAKYQYSSYAYNLLAAVVENASGKSFRDYLREKIFKPAEMTASDLEFLEEPVAERCRQYVRAGEDFKLAPMVDLSCKWAGGGTIT